MKLMRIAVALTMLAVLCAGCASDKDASAPPDASERIQVGGLGKSVHPFWEQVELGMNTAAKTANADIEFFVPSKEDAQKQAEKIKSWVALGKRGILFAASDPETVGAAVKDAIARDIICVAMDTDAPDSGRVAYVGTDNFAAGKIAGEEMGKILGGKGKVAIATGSVTASNSLERIEGFKEALKEKYPGITLLPEVLVDNEDRAVAVQKAKAKLAAVPDLAGFFGVYALNGPCCANAVKSAGKTGKVRVVCFDNLAEHMNMLKAKEIDIAIGQRPYLMGLKGTELISAIIREGKDKALQEMGAKDGMIDTGVDVITPADVEEYRAKLKELGVPVTGW